MKVLPCGECGKATKIETTSNGYVPYCQPCRAVRRDERKARMPCTVCGIEVVIRTKSQRETWRAGRAYCSEEHKRQSVRALLSATAANWATPENRAKAAERMRRRNPMKDPVTKAKAATTRRAGDWRPKVRGGNGTGPTVAQQLLASRLGWDMEHVVVTGANYKPNCYLIDIAEPTLKVAIEVDGNSHQALTRKKVDARKTKFLVGHGWIVLRFSNREATERTEDCVQVVLSTISKLQISTPTSPTA